MWAVIPEGPGEKSEGNQKGREEGKEEERKGQMQDRVGQQTQGWFPERW